MNSSSCRGQKPSRSSPPVFSTGAGVSAGFSQFDFTDYVIGWMKKAFLLRSQGFDGFYLCVVILTSEHPRVVMEGQNWPFSGTFYCFVVSDNTMGRERWDGVRK